MGQTSDPIPSLIDALEAAGPQIAAVVKILVSRLGGEVQMDVEDFVSTQGRLQTKADSGTLYLRINPVGRPKR